MSRFMTLVATLIASAVLIAGVWLDTLGHIEAERRNLDRSIANEAENLAVVFENLVARTVTNVDQTLIELRNKIEDGIPSTDWPSLIATSNFDKLVILQLGIIDASGMLVAASSRSHLARHIDLSDRPHFLASSLNRVGCPLLV